MKSFQEAKHIDQSETPYTDRDIISTGSTMHEKLATDTIISTNMDYTVFMNQTKDFILKLTLHEAGKTKITTIQANHDTLLNELSSFSRLYTDAPC